MIEEEKEKEEYTRRNYEFRKWIRALINDYDMPSYNLGHLCDMPRYKLGMEKINGEGAFIEKKINCSISMCVRRSVSKDPRGDWYKRNWN